MKWPFFHCADCPDKFVTSKLPWKKLHPGSIWSWHGCNCMMKSKQEKPQSNLPPPRTYVWNMWLVIMNPILTVFWPINNRIPVHLRLLCLHWNWQCFLLGCFSLESWIFLWWGRPGCCGRQQGQGAVEYTLSRQLLTPLLYVKNMYIGFSQN